MAVINRIVFANPHNVDRAGGDAAPGQRRDRKNLSVTLSYDEGRSRAVPKPLEPGISGYSDLAVGPDGTIYFYERGDVDGKDTFATRALTLARFNLEWLTDGMDVLASPPRPLLRPGGREACCDGSRGRINGAITGGYILVNNPQIGSSGSRGRALCDRAEEKKRETPRGKLAAFRVNSR